ncbi:MAG: MFS transporter [Deltaproteobacteria bacterium]|nr:MFS transporter [Deltaproteobacteria bacterium]
MFNIVILGLTSLLTDIASEMIYPLVPFFLTVHLGATPAVLGTIEGLGESVASLLKVFSGYLSDRFNDRKTPTILGYACSALGKLLLSVASGWSLVLGGRVVDRIGKGIRTAPRDALVAESADSGRHGRAFGLHRALDSLGAVIGVTLGYYFFTRYTGDYTRVFLWSLVPALAGVALLFLVREAKRHRTDVRQIPSLRWHVLPARLRWFLVVSLLFTLGNSSNTFLLLRAQNLGYSPASVILLYLTFNVVYAVASYPAGWLSDHLGRKVLLVSGYVFYSAVYFLFAVLQPAQHDLLWGVFALYGLYMGVTDGVEKAFVTDLAPASLRATGLGLHATIVGIGLFPASFVAGELWQHVAPPAVFYFGGSMGLIAALGLILL